MLRFQSRTSEKEQPITSKNRVGQVFFRSIFNRENLLALAIALLLIAIYIATAADSPLWVYQGF